MNQQLVESSLRQLELTEDLNAKLLRAMRETNHRVKNNLQMITALVDAEPDSSPSNSALFRVKQMLRSLATIHDLLTAQDAVDSDFTRIPADIVLGRVTDLLRQVYCGHRIDARIAELPLTTKRAAALALLMNECVSNALKHGAGGVTISMWASEGEGFLQVSDDGQGFPEGFDPEAAAHTGLDLVMSVARWDLQGMISFDNKPEGGAQVTTSFPLDARAASSA